MSNLVPSHGGKLLPLLGYGSQWKGGIKEAEPVPNIRLNLRGVFDLSY